MNTVEVHVCLESHYSIHYLVLKIVERTSQLCASYVARCSCTLFEKSVAACLHTQKITLFCNGEGTIWLLGSPRRRGHSMGSAEEY